MSLYKGIFWFDPAICFIHRKENASACEKQEEAEIIIPRNKLGDCGSITLMWKKNFIKFCKKGNEEETL